MPAADEKFPCENPIEGLSRSASCHGQPLTRIRFRSSSSVPWVTNLQNCPHRSRYAFPAFSSSFQRLANHRSSGLDSPRTSTHCRGSSRDPSELSTPRGHLSSPRLVSRVFRGAASVTRARAHAAPRDDSRARRGDLGVRARRAGGPRRLHRGAPGGVADAVRERRARHRPDRPRPHRGVLRRAARARRRAVLLLGAVPGVGRDATGRARPGAGDGAAEVRRRHARGSRVPVRGGRRRRGGGGGGAASRRRDAGGRGRETCPTRTLIRLVQDGCAGALTETCCDAIASLNARSCFCEDDVVDVLRSFPASFRRMFAETSAECGFIVRGGRRCVPFPAKPPTPPAPFPPYPPYPPYPPTPPTPPTPPSEAAPEGSNEGPTRGPDQRVDVVRVCDPGAYVSLLDVQRCDVTLLVTAPASDDATALDACCESIGLLDQALCLCDPNIASLIAQTRFASTPMLNSVYGSCGFRISTLDSNGMCVRVGSPMFGPPPVRGRPPRPSRPPSPSPPVPGAPSGPSGPPGPPGRTVVLAGAGRVPGSAKILRCTS